MPFKGDLLKNMSAAELAKLVHEVGALTGAQGGAAGTGAVKRRGGRTKAQRSRYYRQLARKSHQAREKNKRERKTG